MTRFVLLLAAAAVAGVMYAAAAPGGLTRSGPTTAQFKALSQRSAWLRLWGAHRHQHLRINDGP